MFGVYLLYIKREREKDRITDVRLFMQTKRKQKILTHIHMYAYVCVCAHWYVIENRFVVVLLQFRKYFDEMMDPPP